MGVISCSQEIIPVFVTSELTEMLGFQNAVAKNKIVTADESNVKEEMNLRNLVIRCIKIS